ncbi:MAG: serine hydrolase domain-containing protein [Mobilitalea sp.]
MEQKNLNYLSTVLQEEIDSGAINGAAIRVIQNNETVYEDTLGYADKEKGVFISEDTIYRMYSMSKPITAVAAMILYERGMLNLLAPVSDYLDGFKNQKVLTEDGLVDAARQVTIQDLLNMTSGIVYPDDTFEVGRKMASLYSEVEKANHQGMPTNTIDFCNQIGQIPLEFHPGDHWRYGASADVLGAVIEIVSKRKLSQFLQEEIFTPLEMEDTGFYVPNDKHSRFSQIYDYKVENNCLEPFTADFLATFDHLTPPAFESGGAGLVSTVKDYSRFALMLVNGGMLNGTRILSYKTVDYLSTPQLTTEQAVTFNWDSIIGYNYGNLMRSLVDPAKAASNGSIGEFGWDGWTGNYFFVDPKEVLVMIYMIQRCGGTNPTMFRKLRSIIYGAL